MKECKKCKQTKYLEQFRYIPRKDIYTAWCSSCIREREQEYRDKNRENFRVWSKEYRDKHREEMNQRRKDLRKIKREARLRI